MSFKKILGTLSPVYGAISGEGAMGKILNPGEAKRIADEENARAMASQAAAEQSESNRQATAGAAQIKPMKKGGSASSRADGCAVRGKTRGKIY